MLRFEIETRAGYLYATLSGAFQLDSARDAYRGILQAVRSVAHGGSWFSQQVVAHLVHPIAPDGRNHPNLTQRELQIVQLIARGWDNARIAGELSLGEQTIRNYVSRVYGKIGVQTRAEAVVWARDNEMTG